MTPKTPNAMSCVQSCALPKPRSAQPSDSSASLSECCKKPAKRKSLCGCGDLCDLYLANAGCCGGAFLLHKLPHSRALLPALLSLSGAPAPHAAPPHRPKGPRQRCSCASWRPVWRSCVERPTWVKNTVHSSKRCVWFDRYINPASLPVAAVPQMMAAVALSLVVEGDRRLGLTHTHE
jgi:hypothetical protein